MAITVVVDENIPFVQQWLASAPVKLIFRPGRTLAAADLRHADALLVRSVTRVNEALLEQTPVRFVGSATIGRDHLDLAYLSSRGLDVAYAPGSNAQSVVDWLLSVLAFAYLEHNLPWWQRRIGIVGVGHIGSALQHRLQAFGCELLLCDPPRFDRGELPQHQPLEALLSRCDLLCFHTPYSRRLPHATHQLFAPQAASLLKPGAWLVNAGRGAVMQQQAIMHAINQRSASVVLDVWPHEPEVDAHLLDSVVAGSPHVAGYSLDGKFNSTAAVMKALAKTLSLPSLATPTLPPAQALDAREYQADDLMRWASRLVLAVHNPAEDTLRLRRTLAAGPCLGAAQFDGLRKHYRQRREIAVTPIRHAPVELEELLRKFGFRHFMGDDSAG